MKPEAHGWVYVVLNQANDKVYVGQTTNIKQRWCAYRSACNGSSKRSEGLLVRAMRKYGFGSFCLVSIYTCSSQEELNQVERVLIAAWQCQDRNLGYNIANGGDGKGKHSPETLAKMSAAHKGKKRGPLSAATRAKISTAQMGKKCPEISGARCHLAKVTADQARAIAVDPRPTGVVAAEYSVTKGTVCLVRQGKIWGSEVIERLWEPQPRSRSRKAALTESQVRAVRSDTRLHTTIAAEYGVSASAVSLVKRRKSYTWVTDEPTEGHP